MRLRRWIVIVAMLGVLLHVGALVRHHGAMLATHVLELALASELAAMCYGGEDAASRHPAGVPGSPKPLKAPGDCPICSGQAPAFAVAAPDSVEMPVRFAVMARWCEPERVNPALRHAVCPPPRGPPASALSA